VLPEDPEDPAEAFFLAEDPDTLPEALFFLPEE
jgi:hypothetical protein